MKLRDLLHKAVMPRISSQFGGILLEIPEFDDDSEFHEDESDEASLESISGLAVVIEYSSAKGETSQRLITCKQFSKEAEVKYLKAFCHRKQAVRTFRMDRIGELFDPESGESLGAPEVFFGRFSPDKTKGSPLGWGLSVGRRADLIAMLNALVFVARCDREFHPAEKNSLEAALTSFWLRLEILGDPDFQDILDYASRLSPDGEIFWLAMKRFRANPVVATIFRQQVQALIEADGFVRQEEAYWSLEIDEFLSSG